MRILTFLRRHVFIVIHEVHSITMNYLSKNIQLESKQTFRPTPQFIRNTASRETWYMTAWGNLKANTECGMFYKTTSLVFLKSQCLLERTIPEYKGLLSFPGGRVGKESACNAGDLGLIPGSGRSLGKGNGNLLQYSCLKIPWTGEPGGRTTHGDGKQLNMTGQLSKAHRHDEGTQIITTNF